MLYYVSRVVFELLLRLLTKLHICGREHLPEAPFILASNHASILDPPLAGIACKKYRVDFMAKKELFERPIFSRWARGVGCIEVKRNSVSAGSLKEAIRRLKNGHVIGMFPEGTRAVDGNLQNAKRGTGFLIDKADVPVVPCYIGGSGEAFPKGGGIKLWSRIDVALGEPIFQSEFTGKDERGGTDYEMISNLVMARIGSLKESVENKRNKV